MHGFELDYPTTRLNEALWQNLIAYSSQVEGTCNCCKWPNIEQIWSHWAQPFTKQPTVFNLHGHQAHDDRDQCDQMLQKKEANFCKSGPKRSQKQFLLKTIFSILPKKLPNILATFLTKNCLQNISKIAQSGALDCDRLTHKLTWMKIFDWLWMRCPDTSGVS